LFTGEEDDDDYEHPGNILYSVMPTLFFKTVLLSIFCLICIT